MNRVLNIVLICVGILILATLFVLISIDKMKTTIKLEEHTKINEMIDYDKYIMTSNEKGFYTIVAGAIIFMLGYIFYRSIAISAILTPLALLYPKRKNNVIIKNRKKKLVLQFREALYSISTSLSAGRTIENALRDALKDLEIIFPDEDAFIIKELGYIVKRIEMNETVEDAINNFALRSHVEDIKSFADVFYTCKRTGGNLVEVIKSTSVIIGDKITVKQEIETMLSEKKLEQKVMTFMPLFMIAFLSLSGGDYMEPIYTTPVGRITMTVSVCLIAASYFISKKVMDIEV